MLDIKVLGPGCANCIKLENLVKEVVAENNLPANVENITDKEKFTELGVWMTPALIVNDQILSQGKIPTKSTLEHWLKKELAH